MSTTTDHRQKLLLSVRSVRELLDFETDKAVYAAAERGQLPGIVKIGRRLRFKAEAIYALAAGKSSKSASGP